MPLVSKETEVGLPVDAGDKALLGTPGSDAALSNVQASDAFAHAVPEQSRAQRATSFDPADFAVPTGREEEWRFTPVDRLQPLFADGQGSGHLDWQSQLPEGVTSETISAAKARELTLMSPADRPAALAFARSGGAVQVDIPNDADVTEPIRIDLRGTDGAQAGDPVFGHLIVTAGRHSRATVVIAHSGRADYSELLSVITGDGAELSVVSLQEWDDEALHLGQQDVVVGRDATVRHIAVTLGGKVVRLCVNARYAGPGGTFQGLGVYFADAGQDLEHRLFVDHEAPRCTSDVEYKGALQGETAHTVWVGDVLIRAEAEGTQTYELNRNLVLTDGARADSVPNLEIETGQIEGAGHASATGRFDDEQLFYLRSRGIPESEARRLVVRGFFAAIVARIGIPEVVEHLMAAIDAELETSMGADADDKAVREVVQEATS
ncbi:Fe-S cluster assembly protein SufD [Kineosphaera limosa]|uniref:FeS assembly protein SufD n=1 Tax=Kineosphaera limosa NBRC 100340 TaxID=1184609 RepID=K6X6N8_9MICO|nr:Fe-S cluster assembly protein SufD [Kineosphaera limosa]NYE03142.1 Fe-S cluster assembly protein SufD [Kineosphaera limosa]GAB94479.1 FeS assembly protein SufD [Kineosphaera limosa NBRC 100340]